MILGDVMGNRVMYLAKLLLTVLQYAIPIVLIVMVIKDLYSNVIKPEDKELAPKLFKKLLAAIIIFLVPTIIDLVFVVVDYVMGNKEDYKASSCYKNASMECIENIESYLDCEDFTDEDTNKKCQTFRRCNGYELVNGCQVKTDIKESCSSSNSTNTEDYSTSSYQKKRD